jgi:hypothetical protein
LTPELQQFTMQRITLLDAQLFQTLELLAELVLPP